MVGAAAATVALDQAAQLLLPALFGFVPAAGLWVTAGLGGVMIPALAALRRSLARRQDPSLAPLVRYADGLLGVLVGAALVTAVGVLGTDVASAFIAPPAQGAGLLGLAPMLGLFSHAAAMPVLYGAGHAAWGLRRGVAAPARFPIPLPFSLCLLPMLLTPPVSFLALTGGVPLFWAVPFVAAAVAAYLASRGRLERMSAAMAAGGAAEAELPIGPRWRLDRLSAGKTTPDAAIRSARLQAAAWGAALVLTGLGLPALFHLSLPAALASVGAAVTGSFVYLAPMLLLSGLAAPFFMGAKPATAGAYAETVRELAARAGLPTPKAYAGAKNGPPNAFAAGVFQRLAVVAVTGFITRLLSVREMRGVLAHELSHVKYRHMLVLSGALLIFPSLAVTAPSLLQLTAAYWATLVWVIGVMGLMRANERMADAGAAKLLGDPRGLATGLRKLALLGMVSGKVPDREGSLLYRLLLSHPDPLERIQALSRMAPAGGTSAGAPTEPPGDRRP
jgi:Zn-dependent protease with chaperone function